MKLLRRVSSSDVVAIATAVGDGDLTLPPGQYGVVPVSWNPPAPTTRLDTAGVIPEFELEIFNASEAIALTNAVLYGARLHPLAFDPIPTEGVPAARALLDLASKTTHCDTVIEILDDALVGLVGNDVTIAFTAGSADDHGSLVLSGDAFIFHYKTLVTTNADFEAAVATLASKIRVRTASLTPATALVAIVDAFAAAHLAGGADAYVATDGDHGLLTGDGPIQWEMAVPGTPPAMTAVATDYWVIVGANPAHYQIAASLQDALSGVFIQFFDAPETEDLVTLSTANTQRVSWQSHDGLLGLAGDGSVPLDVRVGYSKRIPHSPRVVAYCLVGDIDTGTLSAAIVPIQDRE